MVVNRFSYLVILFLKERLARNERTKNHKFNRIKGNINKRKITQNKVDSKTLIH